jgi:carbon monoxide dehydrogenase subunit G
MSEIEVSRTVRAPVERVWEVFTDLSRAAERLSGVEKIEVLNPGDFKVGTTWRETRTMHGKSAVEQMTVTVCEPPDRYLVEAQSRGTHYRSEFTFTPEGGDTVVRMTFGAEPHGAVGKVVGAMLGGLMSRAVTKTMQQDLDDLADAAEKPA